MSERLAEWRRHLSQVLVGKGEVIEFLLVAVLAGGHVLLDDVPGTGKTTVAKGLAESLGLRFRRIQFTPDLMPSDIVGSVVYNRRDDSFETRLGPIFANVVLADEINRAAPRTQSALLEAMAEGQVSIDGVTHPLPDPFVVLATQNPIELEGTFPLPEAQTDRFALSLTIGYPDEESERAIVRGGGLPTPFRLGADELARWRREAAQVHLSEPVLAYAVDLVRATRSHPAVRLGGSPRASIALASQARTLAYVNGRDFVLPDDVQRLFPHVLRHRLVLSPEALLRGETAEDVLTDVLSTVPAPVEERR
jgi:MoxR-like ATPase